MPVRQVRVFAPSSEPWTDWAETLIGRVLQPLAREFADDLDWFWFSRYGAYDDDSGDCDLSRIPEDCKQPVDDSGRGFTRSIRFRFALHDDDRCRDLEQRAAALLVKSGYKYSDFRDYNFISDLGCKRFLGTENRQPERAEQRALLMASLLCVTSRLVIDALVGPDSGGRYKLETNDDLVQNPRGSSFQSILHLFCNITEVPTEVIVSRKANGNKTEYGTFMYSPEAPTGGWDSREAFKIRY